MYAKICLQPERFADEFSKEQSIPLLDTPRVRCIQLRRGGILTPRQLKGYAFKARVAFGNRIPSLLTRQKLRSARLQRIQDTLHIIALRMVTKKDEVGQNFTVCKSELRSSAEHSDLPTVILSCTTMLRRISLSPTIWIACSSVMNVNIVSPHSTVPTASKRSDPLIGLRRVSQPLRRTSKNNKYIIHYVDYYVNSLSWGSFI